MTVVKDFFKSPPPDPKKYVDFFGYSEEGSVANIKLNRMLDLIEQLYDKESMPEITQIMLWSETCGACEKSLPLWRKLTKALTLRLRNYTHMTIGLNQVIEKGGEKISGGFLFRKYKANGTPAFLQDFKIEVILSKKGKTKEVREIIKTNDFYLIAQGQLQPFLFLSKTFDVPNLYIDDKILNKVF